MTEGEEKNQLPIPRSNEGPSTEITMDLEAAREVLNNVAATSENTVTGISSLGEFAGYPVEVIRRALSAVSLHLIATHPKGITGRSIEKDVPRVGSLLKLQLKNPVGSLFKPGEASGTHLDLQLNNPSKVFSEVNIGFGLTLVETPITKVDAFMFGFRDGKKRVSLEQIILRREPRIDEPRFLMRGLRWMAANLARWDQIDAVLPSELDSLPLGPGTPSLPPPIDT